jgi:hypothetical protein
MDRFRILVGLTVLAAAGCGGASEAGPRLKRQPFLHEIHVSPEAAANSPVPSLPKGPTEIPSVR